MKMHFFENLPKLLPQFDLMSEIQRKNEVIIIEQDRNLRTHADFKNYKRRIEREKNKIIQESNRELLIPLLDIIDDIEKVLQLEDYIKPISTNVLTKIHKKLLLLLENRGILPFESTGSKYDHTLHDAVAMVNQEGVEQGIVVDTLSPGYFFNSELLRSAKVKVTGY